MRRLRQIRELEKIGGRRPHQIMKTGSAYLPLHHGKAPAWLFGRMKKLAGQIAILIVREHGTRAFLTRFSDPFWFQAFGCVLGFDWHSSGLTTTVCGALKEGLRGGASRELGLHICGGKGATSRKTPSEIETIACNGGLKVSPKRLVYSSRMSAKVDSAAVQDGYGLYHHCFAFDYHGNWAVVQQGMNTSNRWARRYHWLGEAVKDFTCEPHAAVCCNSRAEVLNMVARESDSCRRASAALAGESPIKVATEFTRISSLRLPSRHAVALSDIKPKNLARILEKTYERKPEDFEQLLGMRGVGPKTIRALSLVADLVYASPPSFRDPAKFSFAHGGKDGHPYPVNRKGYDETIAFLREAVNRAKVERSDKVKALRRLSRFYH